MRRPIPRAFSLLATTLLLTACGSAPTVAYRAAPERQDSFDVASLVTEDTLSDMRGGFIAPGGFSIGFGLNSSTLVNGAIATSLDISSSNINNLTPQGLQQLVQVGSNNTFSATPATLSKNVLTLVQNNVNNTVIQNTNVLNVNVTNFSSFRNQMGLANAINPLIRALH